MTTDSRVDESREAFEKWHLDEYKVKPGADVDGDYINPFAHTRWKAWQASWNARTSPVRESGTQDAAKALSKAILEAHAKWADQYQGVGHK